MIVDGAGVGTIDGGEASCVSEERGIIAADELSGDGISVCGSSIGGLSLRLSAGNTALVESDR